MFHTTHQLAANLRELAEILEQSPDVELKMGHSLPDHPKLWLQFGTNIEAFKAMVKAIQPTSMKIDILGVRMIRDFGALEFSVVGDDDSLVRRQKVTKEVEEKRVTPELKEFLISTGFPQPVD